MKTWLILTVAILSTALFGCSEHTHSPTAPIPITDSCANPAPFVTATNPIPDSYVVVIKDTLDLPATVRDLEKRYSFTHSGYVALENEKAFSATFGADRVQTLRCDPAVKRIAQNSLL